MLAGGSCKSVNGHDTKKDKLRSQLTVSVKEELLCFHINNLGTLQERFRKSTAQQHHLDSVYR